MYNGTNQRKSKEEAEALLRQLRTDIERPRGRLFPQHNGVQGGLGAGERWRSALFSGLQLRGLAGALMSVWLGQGQQCKGWGAPAVTALVGGSEGEAAFQVAWALGGALGRKVGHLREWAVRGIEGMMAKWRWGRRIYRQAKTDS